MDLGDWFHRLSRALISGGAPGCSMFVGILVQLGYSVGTPDLTMDQEAGRNCGGAEKDDGPKR